MSRVLLFVALTAAIAAAYQMGRGNKILADQVAVASMRRMLNKLDMKGIIKIGEGERSEMGDWNLYLLCMRICRSRFWRRNLWVLRIASRWQSII